MQKPRFRTVDKSAWLFVTTRLHPTKPRKLDKRSAIRCGYLAGVANRTGREGSLPTPFRGEAMSDYLARIKPARHAS